MGNRQDGMWTGKAGEIFGVRREEIGAVVLGDGRRGGGGALLGVWCEEMGREERASFELGGKRTNFKLVFALAPEPFSQGYLSWRRESAAR